MYPSIKPFFTGIWKLYPDTGATLKRHQILGGFGNIDSFTLHDPVFEAMTLRLFNPATKLWSIYWADNQSVTLDVPVVGSFEGGIGEFYAKDVWDGTPIIMQFRWDKTDLQKPVWSQAFSADGGENWEWNWYMTFHRQE